MEDCMLGSGTELPLLKSEQMNGENAGAAGFSRVLDLMPIQRYSMLDFGS